MGGNVHGGANLQALPPRPGPHGIERGLADGMTARPTYFELVHGVLLFVGRRCGVEVIRHVIRALGVVGDWFAVNEELGHG